MSKIITPDKFKQLIGSLNRFKWQCFKHGLYIKPVNNIKKSKDFIGYMLALNIYYWYIYSSIHINESPRNKSIKEYLNNFHILNTDDKKMKLKDINYDYREYQSGFIFKLLDELGDYFIDDLYIRRVV